MIGESEHLRRHLEESKREIARRMAESEGKPRQEARHTTIGCEGTCMSSCFGICQSSCSGTSMGTSLTPAAKDGIVFRDKIPRARREGLPHLEMIVSRHNEEMERCPNCGGVAHVKGVASKYEGGYFVECASCRLATVPKTRRSDAVDTWYGYADKTRNRGNFEDVAAKDTRPIDKRGYYARFTLEEPLHEPVIADSYIVKSIRTYQDEYMRPVLEVDCYDGTHKSYTIHSKVTEADMDLLWEVERMTRNTPQAILDGLEWS